MHICAPTCVHLCAYVGTCVCVCIHVCCMPLCVCIWVHLCVWVCIHVHASVHARMHTLCVLPEAHWSGLWPSCFFLWHYGALDDITHILKQHVPAGPSRRCAALGLQLAATHRRPELSWPEHTRGNSSLDEVIPAGTCRGNRSSTLHPGNRGVPPEGAGSCLSLPQGWGSKPNLMVGNGSETFPDSRKRALG